MTLELGLTELLTILCCSRCPFPPPPSPPHPLFLVPFNAGLKTRELYRKTITKQHWKGERQIPERVTSQSRSAFGYSVHRGLVRSPDTFSFTFSAFTSSQGISDLMRGILVPVFTHQNLGLHKMYKRRRKFCLKN